MAPPIMGQVATDSQTSQYGRSETRYKHSQSFMHAIYINLFKALIKLWRGEFKGLDTGNGHYIIPAPIWERIGIETRDAVNTVPASFVRSMPNIDTDFSNFTAEDSAFWFTWLAPYLLAGRLSEP